KHKGVLACVSYFPHSATRFAPFRAPALSPPIRLGYRGFRQARAPLRRCALAHERTRRGFGLPFPDQPHMQVKSPRRTGTGWLLPVVGVGGPGTFAIDGKSLLMRSLTITTQGMRIVEHARALDRVP